MECRNVPTRLGGIIAAVAASDTALLMDFCCGSRDKNKLWSGNRSVLMDNLNDIGVHGSIQW
jgi:hypothetical protein